MDLQGKVALVTGGAVRIGRSVALGLAREGASIVLHYGTSRDAAVQTADEIRGLGVDVALVQADLRQPRAAAQAIFTQAFEHFGRVDLLVNSAGLFEPGGLADTSDESWSRQFAVNLEAPYHLCREFAARLPAEGRGRIVNIADWRGLRPGVGHLAYTLTKAGLIALTQILAQELGPGVQVNAVAPGAILPPPGADAGYLDRLAKHVALQRAGSPEELAETVAFLLKSDFITGAVLPVTGGEHL